MEGRLKNGVRMNHMITLDKIELLFKNNILVIYNYFGTELKITENVPTFFWKKF